MRRTLGLFAGAIVAAILSACGNPTPITSGSPTPAPTITPFVSSEYPLLTSAAQPSGVSKAPALGDSTVWFTETAADKIGKVATNGVVSEYTLPVPGEAPLMITNGPNDALWYTESSTNQIGFIPTTGLNPTDITLPNPLSRPWGIVEGPDGNLWVTDPGANQILSVQPNPPYAATSYPLLTANANPTAISLGPNGQVWFVETGANKIGVITPGAAAGTQPAEFSAGITPAAGLGAIAPGADGAMWFTETTTDKIGRILANGTVTSETSLAPMVKPFGLAVGGDGNFYIGDETSSTIAQFAPGTGKVTPYPTITSAAGVYWLTIGGDNEVYFTEQTVNKVGQFRYF